MKKEKIYINESLANEIRKCLIKNENSYEIRIEKDHLSYLQNHGIDISQALEDNNLELVLEIIDDAIVDDIVSHNDKITEHGICLQRIYDRIQLHNDNE